MNDGPDTADTQKVTLLAEDIQISDWIKVKNIVEWIGEKANVLKLWPLD